MDDNPPFCGNCGYSLTGLVDSSKCPECGRPLVEILERKTFDRPRGWRYTSRAKLFGLPVIDVALSTRRRGKLGVAKGVVAIGNVACGGIAVGGVCFGVVSIGIVSAGLFAIGMVGLGLICAIGDVCCGGLAAGNVATGVLASGLVAVGCVAQGKSATGFAVRTFGSTSHSSVHQNVFHALRWYFGRSLNAAAMIQPFLVNLLCLVTAAAIIGLAAYRASAKDVRTPHN